MACLQTPESTMAETIVKTRLLQVYEEGNYHTRTALRTLAEAVRRLSTMPGKRTLVLVSPGFLSAEQTDLVSDVLDRAVRASVVINSVDSRGLYVEIPGGDSSHGRVASTGAMITKDRYLHDSLTAQASILGELAHGTGGTFFHNNNDILAGLNQLAAPPQVYYILGFSPGDLKPDGRFHELKVTLNTPLKGLTAQARHGYYAPKTIAPPEEQAREELREALLSRQELDEIPVSLQTQFLKLDDIKARLSVLARIDVNQLQFRAAENRHLDTLTVLSGVFDRNGNMVKATQKQLDMRLRPETLERLRQSGLVVKTAYDVPPGGYLVRLVVRDSEGKIMAAHSRPVEIP
jgi:hypothetical protein